jgi:hypothetical protein
MAEHPINIGQPLTAQNYTAPKVNSSALEKLCSKGKSENLN